MAYNYMQEGARMASPPLACCPPHNTRTLQFAQDLKYNRTISFATAK